jgi:hypothetical protein
MTEKNSYTSGIQLPKKIENEDEKRNCRKMFKKLKTEKNENPHIWVPAGIAQNGAETAAVNRSEVPCARVRWRAAAGCTAARLARHPWLLVRGCSVYSDCRVNRRETLQESTGAQRDAPPHSVPVTFSPVLVWFPAHALGPRASASFSAFLHA